MPMIGVDTGGTFTDLISINDTGKIIVIKVPSVVSDQSLGVLNSLKLLPESHNNADYLVHGTTVATNTMLQRNGAVGKKYTDEQISSLNIERALILPQWNYTLRPRTT